MLRGRHESVVLSSSGLLTAAIGLYIIVRCLNLGWVAVHHDPVALFDPLLTLLRVVVIQSSLDKRKYLSLEIQRWPFLVSRQVKGVLLKSCNPQCKRRREAIQVKLLNFLCALCPATPVTDVLQKNPQPLPF